ncbi:MAG: acyltransferase [Selenomonadaceae bacterium]|nr:acyltransferase [Selenomonadaceae bacterium]
MSLYDRDSSLNLYQYLKFEGLAQHKIHYEVFYHIIASVMITYAAVNLQTLQKFLSWKPFLKVGEYSFSLYLTHAPVAIFFGGFIFLELFHHGYDMAICRFWATIISLSAIILATYLLHHFVDIPSGKLAKRVQKFFE